MTERPPKARYRLTITVEGNTLEELERELLVAHRNFAYDSSDREEFFIVSGHGSRRLDHQNPDMTPERYRQEQDAWWQARRLERKEAMR